MLLKYRHEFHYFYLILQAADYLDEQAEKAGRVFRKKKVATRRWYHKILHGTSESDGFEAFYVGFLGGSVAGVLIGIVF